MDALLGKQYGCELPPFLPVATLREAQQEAQRRAKFLLVLLVCTDHPRFPRFVKEVLASPALAELAATQLVLWGADVAAPEGYALSFQLRATTFPFAALFVKRHAIMDLQGALTAADFAAHLRRALDNGAPVMAREIAFVADREARTRLREAQERELEEARRVDMERRRARQREQEEAARQQREAAERAAVEEAERRAAAEEAERQQRELEEAKAKARALVPEPVEPHTPAGDKADVRLMTLVGSSHEASFLRSAPLSALYHFARSRDDYAGQPFELFAGFPPRRIEDTDDVNIGNAPVLIPRAVVTMREPLPR